MTCPFMQNAQSILVLHSRSNFQLIWRKEIDDIEARQGLAVQKFGYEYQALISFPVNMELSTRYFDFVQKTGSQYH